MCHGWKVKATIALGLMVAGMSVFLASPASADHCSTTVDKDHLEGTGRCGYYVQPSSPSPTPSPLPTSPVTVENRPDVRIVQPDVDPPVRTYISNWRQVSEGQGGLSEQESEWLERTALATERTATATEQLQAIALRQTRTTIFASGLGLFALAGLCVFNLPRVK